ncbi:MAG: hydroxyacid dehydrogenase [Anaerolineae bacterium]|nr:hydroxyacid dehydrogenase [Anaerolineae bacterium]
MKHKVWVGYDLMPEPLALLEAETETIHSTNPADLADVAGVVLGVEPMADGAFMDQAGDGLKVIARHGIGVDNVDLDAATERGILVVNTPDAPTESTAEHAVALLLALAKQVTAGDRNLRGTANIPHNRLQGTEVRGRTLGVVGFGRIGRRVAEICRQGLQMQVVAFDPYINRSQAEAMRVVAVDSLEVLLDQADFVTLHPAFTPETRHLIGAPELQRMKSTAFLINVSRGPVVDEIALIEALEAGQLAGAAMDVFDPEPPAPDNPLFQMSNVVATPHISSFTDLGREAMSQGAVEQLLQVLRGERPPFLVNPEAWPGRAV